ncbi:MAG: hypothetical protein NVS2B17_24840 [Candidatus Velthaea sp.]
MISGLRASAHATSLNTLARDVRDHAPQILEAALARLSVRNRTVAARILIVQFVDRCAVSCASGNWDFTSAWAAAAADRYAEIIDVYEVIGAALESVADALALSVDSPLDRAFTSVRADLASAAARPRAVSGATVVEAVDEIDIVLDSLLTQLDQSDVLTAEHSRAVASWCSRLAKRLGLEKAEIVHLTRAGLIHDIGKVMTPTAILTAPRRLDEEEFVIMRRHAEAGAEIVHGVPLIAHFVPPVRNHHERFDGGGYPDRLKWEAIPRAARIVAVADAFNAMIGRRPYRPPMAPSLALEQLVLGRSTQFDPDVVDAMIDVVTCRG